jgi:hypothetical protein
MKRLLTTLAFTLAVNFLALIGALAYLYKTGKLTDEKIHTIRDLVLHPASQPATQPAADDANPTTQPSLQLEALLAKVSGRTASEQVEFMQRTFDANMALLDRRHNEVQNLKRTVELAQAQLDADRKKLAAEQTKLTTAQQAQAKLETDKGFQDTLALYTSMPAKQVKTIFMTLTDDTMIQYLRAMEPRAATKITKEFKSPEETQRISTVLEKMRQAQASTKE